MRTGRSNMHGYLVSPCTAVRIPVGRAIGFGHTGAMPATTDQLDAQLDHVTSAPSDVGSVECPTERRQLMLDSAIGIIGQTRSAFARQDGAA